jgi:uncharacterized protein (DUF983 family)
VKLPVGTILGRGLRKCCPHCGQGPIFAGWSRQLATCSHCGLVYERNSGDTWLFTIVGDRIPIGLLIVVIYFGVGRQHPIAGWTVFGVASLALLVTAPNRWGFGIALHYLSRLYFRDKADPVPDSSFSSDSKRDPP